MDLVRETLGTGNSAAGSPETLYTEGHHVKEFVRTVSRLQEMQSASWWGAKIVET